MIYYVEQTAAPMGDGTEKRPFRTIGEAAALAQPGDTVLIGEGIYREWVCPPRGGLSDDRRIRYCAAEGCRPVITGAEPLAGWTLWQKDVWRVTADNALFGGYNPYADEIFGDWFDGLGQVHHTGEVFADGQALDEAASLEALLEQRSGKAREWFAEVHPGHTTLYARFGGADPNSLCTEINVRPFCFFPEKEGINYITVSGLEFCCAATQWAPPTAFQPGAVGPNWSKGWIIENCRIHDSKCSGVSLGKRRDPKDNCWSKDPSKGGTQTYTEMVFSTLQKGWNRETVGGHILRGNEIYNCGQAGIVGSMGGAFCTITGNHIHHINIRGEFSGAEMAGIKLHAAIDTVVSRNVIHHCNRGLWLDWQAQGARVQSNAFFCNDLEEDLFIEVCHGPCLVENNLLLSPRSLLDMSQGTAFAHNLFAGKLYAVPDTNRFTLYHLPHHTAVGGVMLVYGGDDRFFNNVFVGTQKTSRHCGVHGTAAYDHCPAQWPTRNPGDDTPAADVGRSMPVAVRDNLYLNGARPWAEETDSRVPTGVQAVLNLAEEGGHYRLENNLQTLLDDQKGAMVTTAVLGKAFQSEQAYEDRDGSPLTLDTDLAGEKRPHAPHLGPLERWPTCLELV